MLFFGSISLFDAYKIFSFNTYLKIRNLHTSCTLDCTLEENAVLAEIKLDSKITQKQIAEKIGKSERTVKTKMTSLEEKGIISREGGKRFGFWKVNI